MIHLSKGIVKIMSVAFLMLILSFTGYQTYSLLHAVSNNPVTAVIGLVLFEGGMIYWWQEFKSDAEGIYQMALSLVLAIIGLLLVTASTALHLGAIDREVIGPQTPARLITLAAIVNLLGKFVFPLLSPGTFKEIWTRALEGMVVAKAYAKADTKTEMMSAQLADEIANEITQQARIRALTNFGMLHGGYSPNIIAAEYQYLDAPTGSNGTPKPSFFDRLKGLVTKQPNQPPHISPGQVDSSDIVDSGRPDELLDNGFPDNAEPWIISADLIEVISEMVDEEARRSGLSTEEVRRYINNRFENVTGRPANQMTYTDTIMILINLRREREASPSRPTPTPNGQPAASAGSA